MTEISLVELVIVVVDRVLGVVVVSGIEVEVVTGIGSVVCDGAAVAGPGPQISLIAFRAGLIRYVAQVNWRQFLEKGMNFRHRQPP